MSNFESELNYLLENTLRSILKIEERAICGYGKVNISINEMHMLEAIGKKSEKGEKDKKHVKISEVSQMMGITLPSATVAINKLVEKGFLIKEKCINDGRVMYVKLTALGEKINRMHSFFHKKISREIASELEEEERQVLIKTVGKLNTFFMKTLERQKNKIGKSDK